MAIKGLTDRGSAFPEIGQIRKGAAKQEGGNRPGADLPYFRVEFDGKDKRGEKFLKVYGPQPTDINVILPFNEIERNWDAWYEAYTAGRMVARSDGENFTYLVDIKTGEHVVINGLDKNNQPVAHRENFLISIEADPEWVKQMLLHVKHLALPGNGLNLLPETVTVEPEEFKALPAGSDNDDEDDPDNYGDDISNADFEEAEPVTQPAAQPAAAPTAQGEIQTPDAVAAAMKVIMGTSTLGAMSVKQLTQLVANNSAAAGLRKFAKIVLDYKQK